MLGVMAPDSTDDIGLADRCAAGDRSAQRQVFEENRLRVHATLYRILGSNREMEDLIQEAFLQIFRSIGSYRGEARLATWISRVTARVAYAFLARNRVPTVALESIPDAAHPEPGADMHAIAREGLRRLYAVLNRIEPKQRIAFALHVIDGRPLREVATITESSLVATKTRVWRARKELERSVREAIAHWSELK